MYVYAGVDDNGLRVLHGLLDETDLIFKKQKINYEKGVLQGSVLSPVLFNVVYEIILKEAKDIMFKYMLTT